MPLVTLQTDLKSLRYGKDKAGGGSSNQPYITTPIPGNDESMPANSNSGISSPDYLLRGGLNAARDTATDLVRLGRFFTDTKSPRGFQFISKQNFLSNIAVRTQASGVGPNEGVYTPLSTLAQAGINFIGGHVDKQGINPIVGVTTYEDEYRKVIGLDDKNNNRLVVLSTSKITNEFTINPLLPPDTVSPLNNEILSYQGGPNSNLGLGKTNIKIAQDNQGSSLQTGLNNINLQNSKFFDIPSKQGGGFDVFKGGSYTTITSTGKTNTDISDFREEIYQIGEQSISYVTSIAPSYNPKDGKTYEGTVGSRVGITSPGLRGDKKNYTAGKIIDRTEQGTGGRVSVVDEINFQPIYQSSAVRQDDNIKKNDLVKFRIAAINQSDPNLKQFIHFRAFINSFSDAYGASWTGQKYMGRGEQFYKYGGFSRDINMSFTVAAQSKPELMAQYKKLNFLASNLAPIYSSEGYMGGPLIQLTMGGWCYELPGFIESLSLEIPQESTWEIGINGEGESDHSVKEMPHICNVTMKFTPIHTFRPEKQKLTFPTVDAFDEKRPNEVATYGPQRYLELTNGFNNNYVPVSLANATNPDYESANTNSPGQ
jgi:hypothetical protein